MVESKLGQCLVSKNAILSSQAIANIYMEYFSEIALGLQCPIPTPCLKRYVDDIISIVKKIYLYGIQIWRTFGI